MLQLLKRCKKPLPYKVPIGRCFEGSPKQRYYHILKLGKKNVNKPRLSEPWLVCLWNSIPCPARDLLVQSWMMWRPIRQWLELLLCEYISCLFTFLKKWQIFVYIFGKICLIKWLIVCLHFWKEITTGCLYFMKTWQLFNTNPFKNSKL